MKKFNGRSGADNQKNLLIIWLVSKILFRVKKLAEHHLKIFLTILPNI